MRPLTIEEKHGVMVVSLDDGVVLNEAQNSSLRQVVYTAISKSTSPKVAFDMTMIDYLTSTGIAVLIGTLRRVHAAEGRLVLFGLRSEVLELFGIMKLSNYFEMARDEAQALQLLSSPPSS